MGTELVAREVQRASALDSLRRGRGVVMAGESGVGKTTLARSVVDELAADGTPVVRLVATLAGRALPFGALGPLLGDDPRGLQPALVPALATDRLRALPGSSRPVLLVDDAHLLDDPSASAILTVVLTEGARLVVTVRGGVPTPDAVTALWRDDLLDRLDLVPLDPRQVHALLRSRLGGEVALTTARMLWEHTQGNPMYVTELVRYGRESGRLVRTQDVWWWEGEPEVPPRLSELLAHRLRETGPAAAEVLDLLALSEPVRYETLAAVSGDEAILEAEERGLVASDDGPDGVRVRFAHPLMRAVATRRLTPVRRRVLADRLRRAPGSEADLLRRATWEAAGAERPDVELLVRAAHAVLVADPHTAVRFAERAAQHDDGPGAAVILADAQAELGRTEDALESLRHADLLVRDDAHRAMVGLSRAGLMLWSMRSPDDAITLLDGLVAQVGDDAAAEARSAGALMAAFGGRPREALRRARQVLASEPPRTARLRAMLAASAALSLSDEPEAARQAARALAAEMGRGPVRVSYPALAAVFAALGTLLTEGTVRPPRSGGQAGRWPQDELTGTGDDGAPWPLVEGMRLHLVGDLPAAVTTLREALVQQLSGEGLFRSEASSWLTVALAASGETDAARRVAAEHPPDAVAVVPGLAAWVEAHLLAADGRVTAAGAAAVLAARTAHARGAVGAAIGYLADAGRFDPRSARQAAEELVTGSGSPLGRTRLAGVHAWGADRAAPLLAAAEEHARLGVLGEAQLLAERAALRAGQESGAHGHVLERRAQGVAAEVRARLGAARQAGAPGVLTRREAEIAGMASQGWRDRDIAEALVVSVRTVESHLASAYRKLGITSRRELVSVLRPTSSG